MADDQEKKAKFIKLGVSAVLLVIAGVLLLTQFKPPKETVQTIWYWDESAKKLVAAPDELSPVRPPGAPVTADRSLVRAYLFSCSNCSDVATLTPVYIEKFPDEARPMASRYAAIGNDGGLIMPHAMVKRPADANWVGWNSEEGVAVREIKSCADGSTPQPCENTGP